MQKRKKMIAYFTVLVALVITLSPPATAASSQRECVAFGYVGDIGSEHLSYAESNTYVFGGNLWIETNCEQQLHISIDGNHMASTNHTARILIPAGIHNITIEGENYSREIVNLSVIPTTYLNEFLGDIPLDYNLRSEHFTPSELNAHEVMIAAVSALILWFLVVSVLSRIVRVWIAHRFCEEVRA